MTAPGAGASAQITGARDAARVLSGRWTFAAIVGAVLSVEIGMFALDMGPETMLVAAVVAFAGLCTWCYFSLVMTTAPPRQRQRAVASVGSIGADQRVRDLRTSILFGRTTDDYSERLHTMLVELVDDQLQHAHDIDRTREPEAASAVLGSELQAFIEAPDPARAVAKTEDLSRIITLVEAL